MAKNINIVCFYASEYAGNFIPSLLHFAGSCDKNINIIFTFPKEAENRYWIKFLEQRKYKVFFLSSFKGKTFKKELKKINKENNINVLYSHFVSGLKIKAVYPFNKKMKLIIHVHSDFSGSKKVSFKRRIRRFFELSILRKDADYIFVGDSLSFKHGEHFHSVTNALCLDRIVNQKLDIELFKKENDIKDSHTVFLMFAWSPYIKGVDVAVKAFLNLSEEEKEKVRFVIVHGRGDGYLKCIDYLSEKLGNKDFLNEKHIKYVKPVEDMFALYSISDVFISASRSEGFSYAILESLYLGLNSIISNIKGSIWAASYPLVDVFESENSMELYKLIKNKIGSKSGKHLNEKIAIDYNINKWCESIKKIVIE